MSWWEIIKVSLGVHWPVIVACVGVMYFRLFVIVFVPISCFKLVFLRKAIMGCKLLNISLNYCWWSICARVCLLFSLYLAALGCMLTKMVLCFYVWVWNVLKVTIYLGGQLSQLVFIQSIHCSPFQQIFLLVVGNVSCFPERLNICA